jgi:two-component system LytT family response regulator
MEEQLKPPFIRVHNSYIINYEQLSKIEDNHIFIADKRIPVSEKFRERFMEVINKNKF